MLGTAYATSSRHAGDRVAYWKETTSRYFGQLDTETEAATDFDARMTVYDVGMLKVFRIVGPSHVVRRTRPCADNPAADTYKLVLRSAGRGVVEQCGRRVALGPGDWSIYDPRVPYSLFNEGVGELLVIQIPRHHLRDFRFDQLHASACADQRAAGLYTICASFLGSMAQQIDSLSNGVAPALADTVLGLVTSTLATDKEGGDGAHALPAVMRMRVKQHVNAHLGESDLSIDRIAREMRCSKRYLHRVFEDEGITLDRYIWRTRLERCREALGQAGHKSASGIAFAWGFNSYAHFCRAFKSHFGISPRDCLKEGS